MSAPAHKILADAAHRPWALPSGPWIMFQSWQELLFAHWPVSEAALRPLVPPELELETFDGTAWIGLTPFVLKGLSPRGLPLPCLSDFPETNLRTYVRHRDKPGVFFFSLDAASRLAVFGARTFYRLPYRYARMRVAREEGGLRYRSRRPDGSAALALRYRPLGPVFHASPGTIEHFLAERYALYVVLRDRTVIRGDIHHARWDLRTAEAEFMRNGVAAAEGVPLPQGPPALLHYSERLDTLIWAPKRVG